jgi:16S rRNA (cytosine967-C5)-methyltransferase
MTPAARLQAVIDILEGLESTAQPADRFLRDWFRARRFAGSADRREIGEQVFQILRRRSVLGWRMASDRPRALVIGSLLARAEDPEAHFAGHRYGPATLTEAERAAIARPPSTDMPLHVRGVFPEFLMSELQRRFGDALPAEMQALSERAPVDLRVNTLKARRDDVLHILRGEGIGAEQTSFAPNGIRIAPGKGSAVLQRNRLFLSGAFEFQDEAAQIAALLCNAKLGQHVLDLAAGAGGKSLALAASMQNEGKIVASDVRKGPLDELRERAARAGADIVAPRLANELRNETFDTVLLDAPCSGTGTWRRQPELRWRLTSTRLDELNALQDLLFDQAGRHTTRGGRLVYATCSVLPRENQERVAAFLERNAGFRVVPALSAWRKSGVSQVPPGLAEFFEASPHRTGTDGFFVAVLRRE